MTGCEVAITGLGIVSPLGCTTDLFASALRAGRTAIGPLGNSYGDLHDVPAARIIDFGEDVDAREWRSLDRVSQFAVAAARDAVADSGLHFDAPLAARTAVILGSTTGGQTTVDEAYARLYRDNLRVPPATIPRWMVNAPAGNVSIRHGITGPSFCIASACASAAHAIGLAYSMVRSGTVSAAITGGVDASLSYGAIKCWEAMRIMAPDLCRPFSRGRRGMTLGEGGAVFVLEPLEHARARGARIHAKIIGFGATSDAGSIAAPTPAGAAQAMAMCMSDAGIAPEQVDYINAHGTGTFANDISETTAIRQALGRHSARVAVSSTKGAHGHALGAAGGLELMATIMAMRDDFLPPTLNFEEPDPECDLDYVPNHARAHRIDTALSNSFAFGGHNAVLAVSRGDYPCAHS
ncbi:MAG TPA: beta-ketoacyl-[acyl-carrier-protein] synthase family protein [Allosphingosinicella sp.]|jgi:nodulation protein E